MEYFEIGKIVNTQGIKGDVRVIPMTDDPKRFNKLKEVEVTLKQISKIYIIEKVWYHKQFVILKFQGINSIDEGNKLRDGIIKIPLDLALPVDTDEYYIRDLYNMSVFTDRDEYLGLINDIIFTGANDVYLVRDEIKGEILIPAIKQCILNVDIKSNKMTVKLLEGLR